MVFTYEKQIYCTTFVCLFFLIFFINYHIFYFTSGKPYFVTSNNETQYGLLGHMSSITVDFVSFPKLTNFSITPDITNSNSSYTFENVTVLDTLYNKSVNVNGRRLTIPVKVENKTFFQPYTVKLSNQNGSSNFTFILSSASKA